MAVRPEDMRRRQQIAAEELELAIALSASEYTLIDEKEAAEGVWTEVPLTYQFAYPVSLRKVNPPGIYDADFPSAEAHWHPRGEPGKYRRTSLFWLSDKFKKSNGLSFRGSITRERMGGYKGETGNELAVFFHEIRDYNGGWEYGWVFRENLDHGIFYTLTEANIEHKQVWNQWPDGALAVSGDVSGVKLGIQNLSEVHYWNIKVKEDGNFLIEMSDKNGCNMKRCTIKKPVDFPNLYGKAGYITICLQKDKNAPLREIAPRTHLRVDKVKIFV